MYCEIANFLDRFDFEKEFARQALLKGGLVNQRAKVVVVRQLERGIVFVQPVNCEFETSARIEATSSRVSAGQRFNLHGRFVKLRPFCLEEREIRHLSNLNQFPRYTTSALIWSVR